MNTLIGLLIIAIGSFGQSSSYVPINKVKNWSWESFWLVQGIFAWLVFPLLGALLAIPAGSTLTELWSSGFTSYYIWNFMGCWRTHFRTEHALLGSSTGTKYFSRYMCSFWNIISCFIRWNRFIPWRRFNATYWSLHHTGGYCYHRICW